MFWLVDLILPVTMIALSFYYRKKAYSDISAVSGFRVKEAMSDKETWKFAHLLASNIVIKEGLIMGGLIILIKLIAPLDEPFWH